MKKFLAVILMLFFAGNCFSNEYIPKKIHIWVDKEFLEYCEDLAQKDYKVYSTETEKQLIKELIELLKLQLKTNLILIKQNKQIIELLKKK